MSTEFVILRAEPAKPGWGLKTILVEAEHFEDNRTADDVVPQDYFTSNHKNAEEVGRIQVMGDTDQLDQVYLSDD